MGKRQKGSLAKVKKYRIHLLASLILVVALIVSFGPYYLWNSQLDQQISQLTREKTEEAQKNLALKEEIRRLNTPEYIEQLARKDLGLVKPGEIPLTRVEPGK